MSPRGAGSALRRGIGAALVLLVVLPVFRFLALGDVGVAEQDVLTSAGLARDMLTFGGLTVVLVSVLLARVVDPDTPERLAAGIARRLVAVPRAWFAVAVALIAFALTAAFARFVLDGKPNLIDAIAQLTHARYLAEGRLLAPTGVWAPFVAIQNSLTLPSGWVSQYPPGHPLLLALGFRLHAVWLVGPALAGATAFFTALAAERLLPDDVGVARVGAALVALSPFIIGLAGAYMNHVTAAAGFAAAVYCAARGRDEGSLAWGVATGVALGFVFMVRPLGAITAGIVVTALWLDRGDGVLPSWRDAVGRTARMLGAAVVGALPLGVAMLVYDTRVFGAPLRLGYMVANGPGMRLGFHLDPWGNWYGPLQALAYTSSDLTALSLNLLETPLPAVIVCGLYLLFAPRLTAGLRVIALWAIVPVAANALYWHHGIFMGPRMLNEVAPAWVLLTIAAGAWLVRAIPRDRAVGAYSVRAAVATAGVLSLAASLLYLAPKRLTSYGGPFMVSTRLAPPQTSTPSLVFVHGAWNGRVAMRLAGVGMRLDSLETVMRQNPTCAVDTFARAYVAATPAGRAALVRTVDFTLYPDRDLGHVDASPGAPIRVRQGERLTVTCTAEFLSDRFGTVDVTPLLWQRDLPGLAAHGAMLVRDLGPEVNQELIRAMPGRRPMFFFRPTPDATPRLVAYDDGMMAVWGRRR